MTPQLRFSEFTDQWQKQKLNNFLIHTPREVPKPNKPYLSLGLRSHFKGTFQKPNSDPMRIAMDVLYKVEPNDFIVNITFAWEGALAIATKQDGGGLVSHRFPTYTFNESVSDSEFFRYIYPRSRMKYELGIASPGGAGRNRVLSKKDFLQIQVYLPKKDEQQKIADYMRGVDSKLTSIQAKVAAMHEYKKGVIQALFSGKFRFKDENGNQYPDWEEKKLTDIGEIVGGGTPDTSNPAYWNGDIYWLTPTEVKDRYITSTKRTITKEGLKNCSAKILPVGTIIFTSRATVGDVAISRIPLVTNQGFQSVIVSSDNDNRFVYFWAINNRKVFLRKSSGSTFPEISRSEMKKIGIILPCLEEQQKIADFLTALDDRIELEEAKLTNAKEFKKALLQRMFV